MKQLHQGLDYTLYKIYIWGGLPSLVIYIVVVATMLERRNQLGSAGGACQDSSRGSDKSC